MNQPLPHVALIVVAYGHAEQLPATLRALEHLDYPRAARTIAVIDNGDGASAAVARTFPDVQVIEPGRNLGFAGGCNLGVARTDAPIIVLINPDLEPRPDFLRAISAPLEDERIGIVGAKLLYPDGQTIQHAGGWLKGPSALAQHLGYGAINHGQHDTAQDVEFVTGAALAIRRTTWNMLGGLDDAFDPAYYEDVDLCWRARASSLIVRYEPRAVAIHQEAAGLGKTSRTYHDLYQRNRLRFVFKHHNDHWLLTAWLPAELAHLRTTADDTEISALFDAYLFWQSAFLRREETRRQGDNLRPSTFDLHEQSELDWTLQQVAAKRTITPLPFRSRWSLLARLRTWLNHVTTEDYLRPLIQQQNDYNAALAELGRALARQRRTTDAAIVCQGVLLAKMVGTERKE